MNINAMMKNRTTAIIFFIGFVLAMIANVYGLIIRPSVCEKKLREYAKVQNWNLTEFIRMSFNKDIYVVYIERDGQSVKSMVEFSLSYKMTWF